MNTKHNSIKHLNMNHTPQRITPRRAKLPLLAAVLILFNIASAWGQITLESGETHYVECGTYTIVSNVTLNSGTGNYNYTIRNNTNSQITISNIELRTIGYRTGNSNTYNYDYVRISDVNSNSDYDSYGNDRTNYTDDDECYDNDDNRYRIRIYHKTYTSGNGNLGDGSITLEANQFVVFRVVRGITISDWNRDYFEKCNTPVGFSATIEGPLCCPDCPTITSPGIVTSTTATLSWGEVSTTATYSVAVTKDGTPYNDGTHSDGIYNRGATESLTLDNLPNGTYTWTLSFVADGCSVSCDPSTFTVIACPTLTSPADNATITTGESLLQWNAMPGATAYNVYIKNADAATYGTPQTVTATSYAMPCSQYSNGTYTWRVVPVVNGTEVAGLTCSERTFTKDASLDCVKAASLYPRYNTIDTLGKRWLSWDAVPCADKYEIYVAPAASVSPTDILTSDDTRLFTTDDTEYLLPIVPEGNYYWTVIPVNTKGTTITTDDIKAQGCGVYTFCVRYETSSDHSVSPSTQGKEFLFSLMQNGYYNNDGSISGTSNNDRYTAIIAPKENATVTFYYYADPTQNQTYTVNAGETEEISMPESLVYHNNVGDQYKNRTVRVTSTADISLYLANEADNSFDASIVLPLSALGQNYMIQTFPNDPYSGGGTGENRSCFMIIADRDNTTVNISGSHSDQIEPSATTVILNEGESYFVRSTNYDYNDLSGLKIDVAKNSPEDDCKTIAVFNGNVVTCIPNTLRNNRDHLVEQAYPISNWGTKFAITSTDGYKSSTDNADADYIRITAAEATTGTINDGTNTTSFTLAAGATYPYPLHRSKGSCYIETNKPVACYLYQRSAAQIRINNSTNNDNMGDPSMVWMSPIERGIEEITFSTFAADGIEEEDHWVNIAIPADALSTTDPTKFVKLDGDNISDKFIPLSGNPDYMYARIQIDHGTHTLVSEGKGKMVVHVYGLGNVRGYAYTAGSAAVPFRSSITLASGEGPAVDVETVPSDYHFCGGVTYRFNTNSNSSNVDSVLFDFDDGKGIQKLILAKNPTGLAYELPARPEEYKITAYIYSTIYDNELCQNSIVVDTVKDKALVFVPANEHIYDTVCNGTPYTFKRYYWTYNNDGVLEKDSVVFTSDAVTEQMDPITINGYSEFGCPLDIVFHLTVYPAVDGGSIEKEEVECKESSLSITKLVNVVSASGGDPSAHYQWQKLVDGNWDDITGQTNDSYTVTAAGTYRRAYLSDCGDAHSTSTGAIVVEHAGSFNPGTHIDDTVNICYGSTFSRKLGGDIVASSIYLHTDGKYYTPIEGEADVPVPMQWQDSVPGGQWNSISGATDYNYTIPTDKTFTQTTYYRRIITGVGSCGLAMNMGVFGVILKPMFEATPTVLQGCNGENNAVVTYTITGGSGNFTVSYSGPTSGTAALENGVYKCSPLRQNATYTFTILDNVHGCEKLETVTITQPGDISISQASAIAGCQGAEIDIPIPEITGGVAPYSVGITSTGLGLPNAGYTINNVQPSTPTSYSYTIPSGISAERKTIHYKVTDANGCTKEVGQDVVTVKAIPQFTLTPENVTSCSNPDGKITATITNHTEGTKYDYYINDTLIDDDQGEAYTFTGLAQGVHTIKVTANNQCSAEQTETVSDDLQLNVEVSVLGATKSGEIYYACPNAQVTIDIVGIDDNVLSGDGGVAANYEYRFSDAGDYGDEYSYKPTTATSCNTSLEVPIYVRQISSGCVDDDLKVTIITQDNTKPEISGDFNNVDVNTYFCTTFQVPDLTEQIRNATTDNCVVDKADFEVTQTIASGDYPVSSGEKTITVKVTDLCGNYASREITVTPVPWDNFEITADKYPNCYCHGDNITLSTRLFEVADADDNAKITYEWYKVTNPGASETLSDPLDKNNPKYSGGDKHELIINSATEADGGTYRVVISYPNGCTRSADVEICVHQAIEFHLE